MKASEVVAMVLTMIQLFFHRSGGSGQPLRLAVWRRTIATRDRTGLVARHTAVAPLRDFEPIPLGIGERDDLLLAGRALRIRDRRERRGENEGGGSGQNGLRDHCPVSSVV